MRPQSRPGASSVGVMGTRAGREGWQHYSPHLLVFPPPPSPRPARPAAGAHVGSGRVLAGDRELDAGSWDRTAAAQMEPILGMLQAPPVFSTTGCVEDLQNFCCAVKIVSWVHILFIFHSLFNSFNVGFVSFFFL